MYWFLHMQSLIITTKPFDEEGSHSKRVLKMLKLVNGASRIQTMIHAASKLMPFASV